MSPTFRNLQLGCPEAVTAFVVFGKGIRWLEFWISDMRVPGTRVYYHPHTGGGNRGHMMRLPDAYAKSHYRGLPLMREGGLPFSIRANDGACIKSFKTIEALCFSRVNSDWFTQSITTFPSAE